MDKRPPLQNEARRSSGYGQAEMTVLDYFNLGLQRGKHASLPHVGDEIQGPAGLTVRYQLRVEHGVVQQVSFKASTCVTLVAYCEMLARWTTGAKVHKALCIRADELADSLTDAPVCKRDRAWLAVQAMQSAVSAAVKASRHQNEEDDS